MSNKKYESIKAKLLKLQALAEKGCAGEAAAAKKAIERLCAQYGVSLADILSEQEETHKYIFDVGRRKYMLTLFCQLHGVVTGKHVMEYTKMARNKIRIELTAFQRAELSNLYEWHKANFKKDLQTMEDTIADAYIQKHNLYRQRGEDEEIPEVKLTAKELARLRAILAMQSQLGDNKYHKAIAQ